MFQLEKMKISIVTSSSMEVMSIVHTNRNILHLHLTVIGEEGVEVFLQVVVVHQCRHRLVEVLKEEDFPHLLHINSLEVEVSVEGFEGGGELLQAVEEEIGGDNKSMATCKYLVFHIVKYRSLIIIKDEYGSWE